MIKLLRRGKKQETKQEKVGRDAKSTNTSIDSEGSTIIQIDKLDTLVLYQVPENFRLLKYGPKTKETAKKEWDTNEGVYTFDKPSVIPTIEFNAIDPDTLALLQKYVDIYNLLPESDRTVFFCACRIIATEDRFDKSDFSDDKEKELQEYGKIVSMREDASVYKERYRRVYNRMRSDFIDNVILPELERMKRKYKGEKLKNVFDSKWEKWLRYNPFNIYTNEFTAGKTLIEGIKERFKPEVKTISVFVKGKEAISEVGKTLKENFSDGYKIQQKERPSIAKMKATKFIITRK